MKLLIVFLAISVISVLTEETKNASNNSEFSKEGEKEETIEDLIKQFEDRATKTNAAIVDSTKDVIKLAQNPIEKSVNQAESDVKSILKNGEEFMAKYNKIKGKIEKKLKECNDKFLGEGSVLGHLNSLKKALETLVTEIKKCPTDNINGMGCTLGKVMRGESIREEAINLMENEKETPEKRAEMIINWVESCNEKAVAAAKVDTKEFMNDLKKCPEKDEL